MIKKQTGYTVGAREHPTASARHGESATRFTYDPTSRRLHGDRRAWSRSRDRRAGELPAWLPIGEGHKAQAANSASLRCHRANSKRKDPRIINTDLRAQYAQACCRNAENASDSDSTVPGPGPDLCHDRNLSPPHPTRSPRDCVSVTWSCLCYRFGTGVHTSLRCTRAPSSPLSPSADTGVVSVVLRIKVPRSTHNLMILPRLSDQEVPLAGGRAKCWP
jgi:hypothetical protein